MFVSFRPLMWFGILGAAVAARAGESPRLAVVIVVDQMREDYLERFRPYFGPDGFRRFETEGTVFTDCHYRHAVTKTAPGHASILTGVFAAQHGIVGNEWYDRDTWIRVESVEDTTSALVGEKPSEIRSPDGVLEARSGRSPRRLLAPTLGDQMKATWGDRCRVVSVAKKDRSAILMGGAKPDGAYWLGEGKIVTSRYYRSSLPAWVGQFNREPRVLAAFGSTWERLLPVAEYDKTQGADDVEGEDGVSGLGRTFPHPIDGGGPKPAKAFFDAYDNSPLNSELVGEFAKAALRGEKLGTHAATDLFCVSFSQIDSCGHNFGPDSHEIMDSMIRLDRVLAGLLAEFDRVVGQGRWVAVLTADHGVARLPEIVKRLDPQADVGRFKGTELDAKAEAALDAAFGALPTGMRWVARDGGGYHVRPRALEAKRLKLGQVLAVLRPVVAAWPAIASVYDRAEVEAMPLEGEGVSAMIRRSYYGARSPDLTFLLKPGWVDRAVFGTNHGMPYDYDTHVPFLWLGAKVPVAARGEKVGVDDLVPSLASLIDVKPPVGAAGRVLWGKP